MEYETNYRDSTYKFVDTGSWIVVYVNGEKWGVPQGDKFLRALLKDIKEHQEELEGWRNEFMGI
jgi:hypothetical protein